MNPELWKQVDELFYAALDLAPDKRAAFLDQACAGNDALRMEVETLLASDEQAGSFIKNTALQAAREFVPEHPVRLSPGETVGPYSIVSFLGAGGMGEVYRARDSRLNRDVAIKILPIDLSGEADRQARFLREARAASALNHPNVVSVYDVGAADGTPYFVSELVDGRPLHELIQKGPMPPENLLNVAAQIAEALVAAHSKGITHRDIKPANIMITHSGQVKVVDFGLAKINQAPGEAPPSETNAPAKTGPGFFLGTVSYMSPEQALARTMDHRSDIFSFGVVLYEMAAGVRPFSGASTPETLDHILHTQPEPISRFNRGAPAGLERVIRKCLEKDPGRRYQSAQDLSTDLKILMSDGAAGAGTVFRTILSRPRSFYIGLFTFLALVILGVSAGLYLTAHRRPIRSIAVMPFASLNANPDTEILTDGITENVINSLSKVPDLRVMAPATVFTYKGKKIDPRQLGLDLRVDAVVSGSLRRQGDTLVIEASLAAASDGHQIWGEEYKRKESDVLEMQSDISREISRQLRATLTGQEEERVGKQYTTSTEAYRLYLKGRYFANKKTNEGLKKAIEYYQQALQQDPNYALAYAGLSDAYGMGDEIFDDYQERSRAAATKALQLDDTVAEAHVSMAGVNSGDWNWAGEEKEYKRAIELNPNLANAYFQYGDLLAAKGDVEKAIAETRMALDLDPLSLHFNAQLGMKLALARRYDDAVQQIQKTIEMDPSFWMSHAVLGFVYLCMGKYRESILESQKGFTLSGHQSEAVAKSFQQLMNAYSTSGAKGYWQKKLELDLENFKPNPYPPELALDYTQMGQKDAAFAWLEKAYEQRLYWIIFDFYIKASPLWDPLRNDPRYTDLLRRCHLED